jgi:hypothetical protein
VQLLGYRDEVGQLAGLQSIHTFTVTIGTGSVLAAADQRWWAGDMTQNHTIALVTGGNKGRSTQTSGAAASSCGARPVLVRVWNWFADGWAGSPPPRWSRSARPPPDSPRPPPYAQVTIQCQTRGDSVQGTFGTSTLWDLIDPRFARAHGGGPGRRGRRAGRGAAWPR